MWKKSIYWFCGDLNWQLKIFKTLLDYEQSLIFFSLSSQTWKIRKWPQACALPSLNLMKRRDCLQSKTLYKERPHIATFCMYINILMICDSRGTANNKETYFLFWKCPVVCKNNNRNVSFLYDGTQSKEWMNQFRKWWNKKKTQGAFTYHGFEAIHYKLLFEMFSYLLTQECFPMGKSVSHAVSRLLNWS